MTKRKAKLRLAEKQDAHRTHAKMRFFQRHGLSFGPIQLREIEDMIARSKVVLVGKLPQVRNYLVAVEGRLIPIGYNTYSKRVVTALPEAAMDEIDPELISLARFTLLKDDSDELIISKIHDGEAELVRTWKTDQCVSYYKLDLAGIEIRTGYNSETNLLVPYVSKNAAKAQKYRAKAQAKHRATTNTAD